MAQTTWQIWRRKKNLYFSTKHKKTSWNDKYPLCRFEEINISIILTSKKNFLNILSFLQNWKNRYYSTMQKIFLNILGLLCRIEEINIFIILPSIKKILFECPGCSLQIWRNKYFYYSTKQKNLLKYPGSSLQNWRNKYFYYSTKQKKILEYTWSVFVELKK